MAEMDRSRSTGRILGIFLTLLALVVIGGAVVLTMRPELFSLASARIVDRVSIVPQDAAVAGGQWRMISQWQGAGEFQEAGNLFLVEFKAIPGWETPPAVVLKKGETGAKVEGVYKPAQYSEQTILTLAGASTLANRLVPELAHFYLTHIGANEVRKIPGKSADEFVMQGIFYSTKEIRSIHIEGRGTPAGFAALKDGSCDVALAAERISADEAKAMGEDFLSAESEYRLGMDAVAVVVHKDNPVSALTVEEVGKIFAGEITNWDQVGGPSAAIKVFALRDTFGTRRFFEDMFLSGKGLVPTVREVDVHSLLPDLVSRDPWAIGFSSITVANQCREMPLKAGVVSEAVLPSAQAIRTQAYPAGRSMYLYLMPKSRNVYALDFIRVSLSEKGQEIVKKFGFVGNEDIASGMSNVRQAVQAQEPVSSAPDMIEPETSKAPPLSGPLPQLVQFDGEVVPDDIRRKVLQDVLDGVFEAAHLPIVFRFEPGSIDLDQQAIKDVNRVVAMMKEPKNLKKKVVLVGYSDSAGAYAPNLAVSRKRAEVVEQLLKAKGLKNVVVLAAGEEGAVQSNESRVGRENNRRVEVWLK